MRKQNFQALYQRKKTTIEQRLASLIDESRPVTVYRPIRYALSSGGKRLRAMLVLLACEAVGGTAKRSLDAAVAIEVLHNFTLVHDDVMDHADVRRNRLTVHKRWDENIAILAGDELIAYAYKSILKTQSPRLAEILDVFTDAFIQVCEGQGYDKEFESRSNVRLDEYLMMIDKKTARVIAAATEIGAIIGNGTPKQVSALKKFGEQIGRAFQIQDDLLDITGDRREFGKKIGGDIVEGKKTFLLLNAIRRSKGRDRILLESLSPGNGRRHIARVRKIYDRTGTLDAARVTITRHTTKAQQALAVLPNNGGRSMLSWLAHGLVKRQS